MGSPLAQLQAQGIRFHLGFVTLLWPLWLSEDEGDRGALPHVPADVPTGVGFIPICGTRGPADHLICPGCSLPRHLAPRGDGITGAVLVSSTATGSARAGDSLGIFSLGAWSSHLAPSRHCVLGRLWGVDLDGAPALSAEAVGERM